MMFFLTAPVGVRPFFSAKGREKKRVTSSIMFLRATLLVAKTSVNSSSLQVCCSYELHAMILQGGSFRPEICTKWQRNTTQNSNLLESSFQLGLIKRLGCDTHFL